MELPVALLMIGAVLDVRVLEMSCIAMLKPVSGFK